MFETATSAKSAAYAAGYIIGPMIHGTRPSDFTVFRQSDGELGKGIYFSPPGPVANLYSLNGRRIEVYIKANIFDASVIDERSCKDLAHRILARGTLPGFNEVELLERIRSTIRGHSNLRKWLERAGYDAITSRTAQLKDQILVFKSNQAKLTDEITYDNNGKPIPMSKRYNSLSPDIRY